MTPYLAGHARTSILVPALLCVLGGCAPDPAAPTRAVARAPAILPLRSLRLYETGVGYFERSGAASGRAITSLPVPAGHLDDALKSLVVLNAGAGGKVGGVAFASSVSRATARVRAGLPSDPDQAIGFRDLLASMKGEKVTIATRASRVPVAGRVIEVTHEIDEVALRAQSVRERKPGEGDGARPDPKRLTLTLTLIGDRGEVRVIEAADILEIQPADPAFRARLDAALDALSTRSAQNARAVQLLGDASGQITFGYIAETPIWRATYRLVQAADAKADAELQGWALVHNDTDERWAAVRLELVNGEPDSFLFPLAAPRYARRSLLHPDEPLSTLPQLQGTTADAMWGDHTDSVGHGGGGSIGYGSAEGHISGSHRVGVPSIRMGATSVSGTSVRPSSVLAVGNLAELVQASGVENGAFFTYALPGGFSLDSHASALVPFVSHRVRTETIALFASAGASARAAVRLVNTTGQTLPAGTIAVFGSAGFAGETTLDRLKPGERRFLQVGNDLDAEVTPKDAVRREESKRVTFQHDQLEEHFLATTELTWDLENRGGAARTFHVGMDVHRNAKITGTDRVDFDEAKGHPIAIFDAPPRKKTARTFTVVEGLSRATTLGSLASKPVHELAQRPSLPAAEVAVLAQAEPRIRDLEGEQARAAAAEKVASDIESDLERLREHMKALGGDKGGAGTAAGPLVKRVIDAEDRLDQARRNKETASREVEKKREAVREVLKRLASR